jgi:hypothetical protein
MLTPEPATVTPHISNLVLAHGQQLNSQGQPIYLLGQNAIDFFELTPYLPYLVRVRFLRQGHTFPGKTMEPIKASKLQVRLLPETPQTIIEPINTQLTSKLNTLALEQNDALELTVQQEACCHSPCYGCLLAQ